MPLCIAGLNLHVRTVLMELSSKPSPNGVDTSQTWETLPESSIIIFSNTNPLSLASEASGVYWGSGL